MCVMRNKLFSNAVTISYKGVFVLIQVYSFYKFLEFTKNICDLYCLILTEANIRDFYNKNAPTKDSDL